MKTKSMRKEKKCIPIIGVIGENLQFGIRNIPSLVIRAFFQNLAIFHLSTDLVLTIEKLVN